LSRATGAITGTPTTAGVSNLTIEVGDSTPHGSATRTLALIIVGSGPLITTTSLPNGAVNVPYEQTIQATGGNTPYSWSVTSGTLPAGVTLNNITGVLSGTPTATGTSNFTVQLMDSSNPAQTVTQALTLVISSANPVPTISLLTPSQTTAGLGHTLQLTIQGTGFVSGSTVSFGTDAGLVPTSIDPQGTQILVTIPASDLASPDLPPVSVTNPSPGGGTSNQLTFSVAASGTYGFSAIIDYFARAYEYGPIITAVDDSGTTVVVGEPGTALVDIWQKNNMGKWTPIAGTFTPTHTMASIALSGDGNTIVVGDCKSSSCVGHVFVYVKPLSGWPDLSSGFPPTAELSASDQSSDTLIGYSVATDQTGDTVAVGAPCDYVSGAKSCGTVYVYRKPNGGWASKNEDAQLTVTGVASLGFSIAMDSKGQTIVAGAPGVQALANTPGSAYLFVEPANGWATTSVAEAALTASNGSNGDLVGAAVSISGDGTTVVAGAPTHPCQCTQASFNPGPGAGFVFVNTSAPNGWSSRTESATLTSRSGDDFDAFGMATGLSSDGSVIVVGAPDTLVAFGLGGGPGGPGSAYTFQEGAAGWSGPQTETQHLLALQGQDQWGCGITPMDDFANQGEVSLSRDGSWLAISSHASLCGGSTSFVVDLFH
jgi:hypothetical protein